MIPKIQSEMIEKLCPMTNLSANCVASKCAVWEWAGEAPHEFVRTVELRKAYPDLDDAGLAQQYDKLFAEFQQMASDGQGGEQGDVFRVIEQRGSWTLKLQVLHENRRTGMCGLANV